MHEAIQRKQIILFCVVLALLMFIGVFISYPIIKFSKPERVIIRAKEKEGDIR